jgi:flagella basal body P-ring formation protein FlgA
MRQLVIVLMLGLASGLPWVPLCAAATDRSGSVPVSLGSGNQAYKGGAGRPASGVLDAETMGKAIQAALEEAWGTQVAGVQVAVLSPSESMPVPAGKMELRVVPSRSGEGIGRRMFHVAVAVNRKLWNTIEVYADVTATIDAIVLNRALKPDEVIDVLDLKTAPVRISQLTHPFVTDQNEVVGKSATRPIPADVPLRQAFVKAPVVMKKGDRVMVEAKRGGLSIQTYGVTKSSGAVGQTIMVTNPDSGRDLRAKVVAPGLVEVEF